MAGKNDLIKAFSEGKFNYVFNRNSGLKLTDHTWQDYDYIFIFGVLLEWLKSENALTSVLEEIKASFEDKLKKDDFINPISNGLESLQFILCYCIVAYDKKYWPLKKEYIRNLINTFPEKRDIVSSNTVERDFALINKYLS